MLHDVWFGDILMEEIWCLVSYWVWRVCFL